MSPPASLVIPEGSSESEEARNEDFSSLTTNRDDYLRRLILDEVEIATTRRLIIHLQSREYVFPAATDFCKKFIAYENTPTVLLVTTVNTKRLGGWPFELYVSATVFSLSRIVCSSSMIIPTKTGTLALSSVSSSRVFDRYHQSYVRRKKTESDSRRGDDMVAANVGNSKDLGQPFESARGFAVRSGKAK
ncbi:hypothetical protein F2Q69_00015920 [Brassica cretica]|uniref:Uncharacterized protein n=1 Tax=Brassica cretica TaxID=69181 RepID=A0A8S9QP22_BRACR|nr:hypothetical protein F2Q69_00015920 [Brassica cretica]